MRPLEPIPVAEVSTSDIKALREATGAGIMDVKAALTEAKGDSDVAADILRKKGLADAAKRADRSNDQGTIGHYLHVQAERPVVGVLVELRCETDFVAKSEEFREAAKNLAMHIAAFKPGWVRREDVPEDVIAKEREIAGEQAKNEGKPDNVIERIIDGRLEAFMKDNVLYEQNFVKADVYDGTVKVMLDEMSGRLGENIGVGKMSRVAVGE
ncbi:MAG: elongation factor Ts [Acidimicrobiia bacterium]|nr:elongation factor Ts [Acidimicrobiia bacterium]